MATERLPEDKYAPGDLRSARPAGTSWGHDALLCHSVRAVGRRPAVLRTDALNKEFADGRREVLPLLHGDGYSTLLLTIC
jgi:hypothetical protein